MITFRPAGLNEVIAPTRVVLVKFAVFANSVFERPNICCSTHPVIRYLPLLGVSDGSLCVAGHEDVSQRFGVPCSSASVLRCHR